MMLNKKGMTIIEIMVSVALVSVVLVFVFQLLVDIKYEDALTRNKTANLINQALVIKDIQDDIQNLGLKSVQNCAANATSKCISFTFNNSTTKELRVEKKAAIYGSEKRTASTSSDETQFYTGEINVETPFTSGGESYFRITVPAKDKNNNTYDIEIFHVYTGTITFTATTQPKL